MGINLKAIKKIHLIIAVAVLVTGGYYWYSKSKSADGKVEYVTEEAKRGMLTTSISASGNVIVDTSANVEPTITGTVANLSVEVGDTVKKGQLLFNIINDDLGVNVAKGASSLESARNSLESARIDADDAEAKYEKAKDEDDNDGDAFSKEELEVLEDKIDLAENKVLQAQKNLDATLAEFRNTQTDAGKRNVTSTIDGTVNEINIKNGDDLSKLSSGSSRTVPIIIGDLGSMKAEVEINEVDISSIQIGQKVMMTFAAIDGLEMSGIVEQMDSLGTLESGVVTYKVTIGFDSLDPRIKPEMSVSANIITDVKQNAITVPNSAVKTQNGESYVEVMNDGETPRKVDVRIGSSNNTDTEIMGGISVGDKVVTQTIDANATTSASSGSRSGNNVRVPGMGGFGR